MANYTPAPKMKNQSSTTDVFAKAYYPGRPLTSAEKSVRVAAGATPQSSNNPLSGAANFVPAQSSSSKSSGGSSSKSSGGSSKKSSSSSESDQRQAAIEAQIRAEIDAAYGAKMDYLGKAESRLKGDLPTVEADVNSLIGESQNTLDTQRGVSEQQLNQQQAQGGLRKEDALTAAVRLYNELVTGGQQRFGGASSAGEAYQALSGRELQRNQQTIGSEYEGFVQQIEGARQNIQSQYTTALQNLDAQKTRMLNEVRRDFQNKLLEIDRLKSEAAGDKANQRLAALQDMRNQIYQINLAVAQGTDSVEALRTQSESELQNYISQSSGATQQGQAGLTAFQGNTTTNPSTALSYNGGQQTTSNPFIQGAISPQMSKREDLFANIFA